MYRSAAAGWFRCYDNSVIKRRWGACLLSAFACAALGFGWQALTVHYNYQGDWTALFVTGEKFPPPPALASENPRVFPGEGYDGQMYHYVAHDPLLRHDVGRYMDNARLRYRRILLPALAFLLAGGRQSGIDASFIACNLLFLFLGAWWLGRYLELAGRNPAWAILFVLVPAALTSLDRLTIDLSLASLCLGVAYYARIDAPRRLYVVLALACLSRETGIVLAIAYCASELARHRLARAAIYATSTVPAALWYGYVAAKTEPIPLHWPQLIPMAGILGSFAHPVPYPFSPAVNAVIVAIDLLALAGILMACVLAFAALSRNRLGLMEIAAVLWALGAIMLPQILWQDCCSSGRVLTPILMFVALRAVDGASLIWIVPLLLVSMRTWLQLLSPLFGILKGVLHRAS